MNPPPTSESTSTGGVSGMGNADRSSYPSNWREALLTLVASRVSLIELESKDAINHAMRQAARILATFVCALFAWALMLSGAIAAVAHATGWPWYWIAIATAFAHMLAAIILARTLKSTSAPAFPVTRSEFQKDREWIENLQKTRKSNF